MTDYESPTNKGSPSEEQNYNDGANFWHYDIGVPTIPGEFKTKKPRVKWEGYQTNPPTEEEHKDWLNRGWYSGGIMILCGPACYRKDRENLYLVGIDIDRQKGIDAFCTRNGKTVSLLEDIAKQTLVEQHEDSPDRCHIYFYSPIKFPVKPPDDVVGIEVKSSWDHGLMRVTPSITENGYPLKIIGAAKEPAILTELQSTELIQHLNHICIENDVDYLQKGGDSNNSRYLTLELKKVIKSLDVSFATKDKVKIPYGYRNVTLLSVANSILFNHLDKDRTNETKLKEFFLAINVFLCDPDPLPNKEAERVWDQARNWAWPRILNDIFHGTRKGVGVRDEQQQIKEKEKEDEREREEKLLNELIGEYQFKTVSTEDEDIWYWDSKSGIYVEGGSIIIQKRLEADYLGRLTDAEAADVGDNENENKSPVHELTNSDVREFMGHIKRRTFFKRSNFDPSIEWLACADRMLNLLTRETAAFSPEFLVTIRIPVYYSENATCPAIIKFLHEVVSAEDVEIILDVIAYCLWRAMPFQHWVLFNAKGGNGKGTLLALIRRFLGSENVSSVSLQALASPESNKFVISQLYGKLANIDADLSSEALKSTSTIKKLTGGDPLYAEFKFKPGFDFVNYAKPLFSANDIPVTPDQTDAFFRRPIIINFLNQFLDDNIDYNLLAKLTTDAELSGLLNIVLERLPKVLNRGIVRVTADTIAQNYEKYTIGSDQVKAFIEMCTEVDHESIITKPDLHEAYRRFCKHFKRNAELLQTFNRSAKDHGLTSRQVDRLPGRPRCWNGIRLIHFAPTQDESQTTLEGLSTR